MTTVTIDRGHTEASIRWPYDTDVLDLVKGMPVRRFDPDGKCWWLPSEHVDVLANTLTTRGFTVILDGQPFSPTPTPTPPSDIERLIPMLLAAVPAHLAPVTYRALAKAWHPDTGGDADLMRALIQAYQQREHP